MGYVSPLRCRPARVRCRSQRCCTSTLGSTCGCAQARLFELQAFVADHLAVLSAGWLREPCRKAERVLMEANPKPRMKRESFRKPLFSAQGARLL